MSETESGLSRSATRSWRLERSLDNLLPDAPLVVKESRFVLLDFYLDDGFFLGTDDERLFVYRVSLSITPAKQSDRYRASDRELPTNCGWIEASRHRSNAKGLVSADAGVRVDLEVFERIWNCETQHFKLDFFISENRALKSGEWEFDRFFGTEFIFREISSIDHRRIPQDYFSKRDSEGLKSALAPLHLDKKFNQVERIAREFAESAAASGLEKLSRAETVAAVTKILRVARSAFRKEVPYDSEEYPGEKFNLFDCGPDDFLVAIKNRSSEDQNKLTNDYCTLWDSGLKPSEAILWGESTHGPNFFDLDPKPAEINTVASMLIENAEHMHSAELEWAVIQALIYCECIEFARYVYAKPDKFGLGFPVPVKLEGIECSPSNSEDRFWTVTRIGLELALLFGLFGVTYYVSNYDQLVSAIITVGYAATRWIVSTIRDVAASCMPKNAQKLSGKMNSCLSECQNANFNAGSLRNLLYSVTVEGACFSPYAYRLLDLRIARDSAP